MSPHMLPFLSPGNFPFPLSSNCSFMKVKFPIMELLPQFLPEVHMEQSTSQRGTRWNQNFHFLFFPFLSFPSSLSFSILPPSESIYDSGSFISLLTWNLLVRLGKWGRERKNPEQWLSHLFGLQHMGRHLPSYGQPCWIFCNTFQMIQIYHGFP